MTNILFILLGVILYGWFIFWFIISIKFKDYLCTILTLAAILLLSMSLILYFLSIVYQPC